MCAAYVRMYVTLSVQGKTVLFDGSCEAGVFSVSPRGFHITPGSSVDVKVCSVCV